MTYHPKMIMSCALFLATKTENYYMSLSQFADGLPGDMSGEDVIKPEFLLMQGLRFTFDVKHPFRGLEGGIMELGSIARGMGVGAPWGAKGMQSAEELKRGLEGVVVSSSSGGKQGQEKERERLVTDRLARAHANTREILKTAAQMTDAYFLYTASQIWLAAFRIADESLMEFYLDTKFPSPGNGNGNEDAGPVAELREKLRRTISDSVALLQSYKPCSTDAEQKRNLKRIAKKRHHCANPRTNPSSAAGTAGRKREPGIPTDTGTSTPVGEGTSETEMERIAKKRKLEREQRDKEGNEVFGGELVTNRTKGQQQQAGTGAEAG